MERRVTTVELRPFNTLTTGQIEDALAGEDDLLDGGPNSVVGLNAPNQYKKIVRGVFYSSRFTGTTNPRAELFFEADPGLSKDKTLRVSGIHKLANGKDFEISKDFRTLGQDTSPWGGRTSYNGQRQTPVDGDGTTATVLFNPAIGTQYAQYKEMVVKHRIASVSATTTTATITFTAAHYFVVGDAVYVDYPDQPFFGLDGLYRVKEVGTNFITYDFSASLEEPIDSAAVVDELYVHAVAQSLVADGSTWVDTSTDPDTVYVWKDLRWVLFSSVTVPPDDMPPGPVQNLEAEDSNDTPDGGGVGQSRVTLTWTAPTTNDDGTPLTDLVGYTVGWRQFEEQEWEKTDFTGADTTWSKGGFPQGKNAYFIVYARDSGGLLSFGAQIEHFVGVSTPEVVKPKAPAVSTYLGTIKVAYDDLTAGGFVQAATAKEIEVYFSDIDGFTPGPINYYGKFPANAGSYLVIPGTELSDGVPYYIKLIVRDIFGNITEPSEQVSITAKLSDIVTYDMIDVGTLTGQVIIGADIRTASQPFSTGGLILNADGLTAYNEGGGQTFRIDADTGQVTIGAYLGRQEALDSFLSVTSADLRYSTIVRADGISLVANRADSTANVAAATASTADTNIKAITEIAPGSVTLRSDKTIGAINKALGSANSSNTTQIEGGVIKTGTIRADQIGTGEFPVGVIYAGTINASNITSGTLTGRTVQTSSSGRRVRMNSSTNAFEVTNTSGNVTGKVYTYGSNSSQIVVESAGGVDSFTASNGFVAMAGTYGSFKIDYTGAYLAASPVGFQTLGSTASNTYNIVHSRNGFGAVQGRFARIQLSGTGIRNVNVGASGILTTSTSDQRLKQNIEPLTLGLDILEKLQPKKFSFKDDPETLEYGLIAQEVREVLAELGINDETNLVFEDSSDEQLARLPEGESGPVLGVEYMKLIPILINSVKELQARVEYLEGESA
jgi:hypothetical protein